MRLSVIMPVFNASHYLEEAIQSILNQDFQDFEFIIVENGSTDNSRDYVESLKDCRLRVVVNQVNVGPPRALNQGLQIAQGTYVARMDADDIALPSRLKSQIAYLEKNQHCAVLETQAIAINQASKTLYKLWYPTTPSGINWKMMFTSPVAHSSVMMRREVAMEAGGYNEKLRHGADYDLWSRLTFAGNHISNLAGTHMHIRMHGESDGRRGAGGLLFDEIVGVSHSNIRHFLKSHISVDEVKSMIALVDSNYLCPKEQVSSAVKHFERIAKAIGGEAELYHAWMLLRLVSTSKDLTFRMRLNLLVRGILTFVNCQKSELKTRFWKDWIFSGGMIRKILSAWQRPL